MIPSNTLITEGQRATRYPILQTLIRSRLLCVELIPKRGSQNQATSRIASLYYVITLVDLENIILGRLQFFRTRNEQPISPSTSFYFEETAAWKNHRGHLHHSLLRASYKTADHRRAQCTSSSTTSWRWWVWRRQQMTRFPTRHKDRIHASIQIREDHDT